MVSDDVADSFACTSLNFTQLMQFNFSWLHSKKVIIRRFPRTCNTQKKRIKLISIQFQDLLLWNEFMYMLSRNISSMQQSKYIRHNSFDLVVIQWRTIRFGNIGTKTEMAITHFIKSRTNYKMCKRCTSTGGFFCWRIKCAGENISAHTIQNWWVWRTQRGCQCGHNAQDV